MGFQSRRSARGDELEAHFVLSRCPILGISWIPLENAGFMGLIMMVLCFFFFYGIHPLVNVDIIMEHHNFQGENSL